MNPSSEMRAAARRTPGEIDVAALDRAALPARRGPRSVLHVAPDVAARRVHQLEFQIVDRAAPAQPKVHGVLARHGAARSARRATTKPLPPLKSKSMRSADALPARGADSSSSALPETVGCHSEGTATRPCIVLCHRATGLGGGAHVDELNPAIGRRRLEFLADTVRSCLSCALTALIRQARLRPRRFAS